MEASEIRRMVAGMTAAEREQALSALPDALAGEMPAAPGDGEERPAECPRCGCAHVVGKGRDADGGRRWLCRGCGRTFRASTGRVLGATKLPGATWARYARAMVAGGTLRACAAEAGVSLKTSFFMRHRVCEVMGRCLPAFEAGPGCEVQIDETLVPDSLSGSRAWRLGFPCPARPGGAAGTASAAA